MTVVESAQRFTQATRGRRTRRGIIAVAVVALAALAVWAVWFSSLLSVKEVRVLGAVTVSVDEVRQAAAVPPGQQLARVDAAGIAARVGAIPRVAAVEIRHGWPDVLVIVITERTPLVVVRDGGGFAYLDASGARFGSVPKPPAAMPVVVSSTDDALASALDVVAALPPDVRSKVVTVTARTRDDVQLSLTGGAVVQWGDADRSDRKAEVLRSLLPLSATRYDVSAPDLPTTSGVPTPKPTH